MAPIIRWLAPSFAGVLTVGAVVLGLWLYIGQVERSARREQQLADSAAMREAMLQAQIDALEASRAIEAAREQAGREANDALLPALRAAHARLDRHLAGLRDAAAGGGAGSAVLPSAAAAAGIIDRADREAVMADDLRICTDNTVRLANAQQWLFAQMAMSDDEERSTE